MVDVLESTCQAQQPLSPLDAAERQRLISWEALDPESRRNLGQFFTPGPLARFIASRGELPAAQQRIRILDPGAGVGSLAAALVERVATERPRAAIEVVVVELDRKLLPALTRTRESALRWAASRGIRLDISVESADFVEWSAKSRSILDRDDSLFDFVIMNPPYAKVAKNSDHRRTTASIACEVTNLYAAFVALGLERLRDNGTLVAITPRSFMNGPYFRDFRRYLDATARFRSVDLFESRSTLFSDAGVLQENVVYALERSASTRNSVCVSFHGKDGSSDRSLVPYEAFMSSADPERFIHLRNGDAGQELAARLCSLPCSLADLGVEVSTGRVVDFRSRESLRAQPEDGAAPLLYPQHLRRGRVSWPIDGKKPNAIMISAETTPMMFRRGNYVAVKRFTSKEERRRVSPTWVPADAFSGAAIAFENHLNVFHRRGDGVERDLAVGLTLFLGSTIVDAYFRQFSGHTQVNATDLRSLRYPSRDALVALGSRTEDPASISQEEVDALVEASAWGSK